MVALLVRLQVDFGAGVVASGVHRPAAALTLAFKTTNFARFALSILLVWPGLSFVHLQRILSGHSKS